MPALSVWLVCIRRTRDSRVPRKLVRLAFGEKDHIVPTRKVVPTSCKEEKIKDLTSSQHGSQN